MYYIIFLFYCYDLLLSFSYEAFIISVPKNQRQYDLRHAKHPQTPKHNIKMSNRRWEGRMSQWRSLLHGWDDGNSGFASLLEMKVSRLERHVCPDRQVPTPSCDADSSSILENQIINDQSLSNLSEDISLKNISSEYIDSNDEALAEAMKLASSL